MTLGLHKKNFNLQYGHLIVLGYLVVIFSGAFLLCLPISTKGSGFGSFWDALFLSVSATCITGLTVVNIFATYSGFGQLIILLLTQIGGLGFMTLIAIILLFLKRKIDFGKRRLLMESMGLLKMSGIVRLVKRIIVFTLFVEFVGAVLLSFSFVQQFGFWQGIWFGIFHSVAAFCNAGFDLVGTASVGSLIGFANNTLVAIVIGILIVIGGIGFLVWNDVLDNKWNISRYSLHSKITLITTLVLIVFGWILFFIFERNDSMKDLGVFDQIWVSFFCSISPRTAGFFMVDLSKMSSGGSFLTMLFMFVGGSSGSTAGGIKTTTFAILLLNAIRTSQSVRGVFVFKRKIDDNSIKQASALVVIFASLVVISTILISLIQPLPLKNIVFEVLSALCTVGLSLSGTTALLAPLSRLIIMLLMLIGRVGCVMMIFGLTGKKSNPKIDRLTEKIQIG